jgi:hypothetical protein
MLLRRLLGLTLFVMLACNVSMSLAAEPVLLRHKFAKGDQLVYRTGHEVKQVQTIMDTKIESTTNQDVVTSYVVDDVDGEGNAVLTTKAVRRKAKMDGDGGIYEFDSKSSERDTGSEIGTAVTPFFERLTGSEYRIKLTPRGAVVEVKGFAELIADLVKDNSYGALLAEVVADNEGAEYTEQEHFPIFSEQPVEPGDVWEQPFETKIKGLGTLKGKATYTYEANDKVGERKTVRIGINTDLTIDLDLDVMVAKLTGTLSTTHSEGTVQFDPATGRVVTSKQTLGLSGQLTVTAGDMVLAMVSSDEHTDTAELLDRLPD